MSLNGLTQEKIIETPETNQKEITFNPNAITNTILSDSLKRVEAKQIYTTPVPLIKENKEISIPSSPPILPKN